MRKRHIQVGSIPADLVGPLGPIDFFPVGFGLHDSQMFSRRSYASQGIDADSLFRKCFAVVYRSEEINLDFAVEPGVTTR